VVLNSHLLGEVEQVCSWAAFIHDGSLVSHDRLDNLSRFKGNAVIETPEPEKMQASLGSGTVKNSTLIVQMALETDFPALTAKVASCGVHFTGVKLQKESLEDIFMRIMEGDGRVS
jgi:ABC-type multidrug transport system ATPase subunit